MTEDHVVPRWFLKQLPSYGIKAGSVGDTEMVCEECNSTKGGKFDFSFKSCRDVMKPIVTAFVQKIREYEEFNP